MIRECIACGAMIPADYHTPAGLDGQCPACDESDQVALRAIADRQAGRARVVTTDEEIAVQAEAERASGRIRILTDPR